MREFVNSLKRLYQVQKIDKRTVSRQLQNKKISEEECKYILDTDKSSSGKN